MAFPCSMCVNTCDKMSEEIPVSYCIDFEATNIRTDDLVELNPEVSLCIIQKGDWLFVNDCVVGDKYFTLKLQKRKINATPAIIKSAKDNPGLFVELTVDGKMYYPKYMGEPERPGDKYGYHVNILFG